MYLVTKTYEASRFSVRKKCSPDIFHFSWSDSHNSMVLKRALSRVRVGPAQVNRTLAVSLLAVALLSSLASSLLNLYEKFWWLDEALHSYFTFSLTLMLALYAYGKVLVGHRQHRILLVLCIAGLGLACGSVWEIAEWGYDQTVSSEAIYGTINPITDLSDSITDLIMDLAGSLAAGIASLRMFVAEADMGEEEP
jgi:VanZ family protein